MAAIIGISLTPLQLSAEDGKPSIAVVAPSNNADWELQTTQEITWTYSGESESSVEIDLLKNDESVMTIAGADDGISIGTDGSGSYNWTIPEDLIPGEDYSIRVTSLEDSLITDTSGTFAIIEETLSGTSMMTALTSDPTDNWLDHVTITSLSGEGTSSSEPYLIQSAEDLAFMSKMVNSNNPDYTGAFYELTENINLSEYYWTPIGSDSVPFAGSFDGGDNNIASLKIGSSSNPSELGNAGLFGLLDASANITNTRVINAKIYATDSALNIGGLAGYNYGGTIENCYATGVISGNVEEAYVGGLVGGNEGSIINSYAACSTEGGVASCVGGLAGYNVVGDISNSGANCSVNGGEMSYAGGFVGCNDNGGSVYNCYAAGDVTGDNATVDLPSYTGGFVGYSSYYISNCYATGNVTGGNAAAGHKSLVGGFIGKNYNNILNCYATGNVSGGEDATLGGFTGGNGTNYFVKLTNTYWNINAVQTIDGEILQSNLLGNGESSSETDTTCGLTDDVMRGGIPDTGITYTSNTSGDTDITGTDEEAFVDALNGGIGSLETGTTYLTWMSDSSNSGYPIFTTDITPAVHAVIVQDDGNGTGSANPGSVLQGETVTLSATPNSNYHFKEWQVISPSGLLINENAFTMPDEVVTVKAIFEADTHTCTVTFNNDGAIYATKAVQESTAVGSADWPANPVKSGYSFGGWYTGTNGTGIQFTSNTTVTAPITVYAKWIQNSGNDDDDTSGGEGSNNSIRTWNELEEAIKKEANSGTFTVDLNDTTVLPNGILELIKGRNITVIIEFDNYTWTINWKNVESSNQNINLKVTSGNNIIDSELVKILADGRDFTELQLNYDGEFGFAAALRFYAGKSHAGQYANFYYFNSDKNTFESKGSYLVDKDGYVNIDFSHASEYVLVFDNKPILEEISAGAGIKDNAIPITENGIPYAVLSVILIVTSGFTGFCNFIQIIFLVC